MSQDLFKCTRCNSLDLCLDLSGGKDGVINIAAEHYKIRLCCRNCLYYTILKIPTYEESIKGFEEFLK
jgi:hypothetical protein